MVVGEWAKDNGGSAEFLGRVLEFWYAAAKFIPGELRVNPIGELFVGYSCRWWGVEVRRSLRELFGPIPWYIVF